MKIQPAVTVDIIKPAGIATGQHGGKKGEFKGIMEGLSKNSLGDILDPKLQQDLAKIEKSLSTGAGLPPHELLLFQIKASQFHLKMELLSKAGESLTASLRKFQQNQ